MYKYSFRIKLGLFLFGIAIVFSVFGLNWYMVKSLREEARQQVEYLAKAYSNAINNSDTGNIQYVLDILLPSIHFPMIITSEDEIYAVKNVKLTEKKGTPEYEKKIRQIIAQMDATFEPLPVMGNDIEISRIHFGDPHIIRQLKWIPYFEVGVVLLFVFFGFIGFQFIRNSEKRSIWVGMARETAHQLGTPISSLMGWTKLLEDGENPKEIIPYVHEDLEHLRQISNRFQKIGSKSKFHPVSLLKIARSTAEYMEKRIPSNSRVSIEVTGEDIRIQGEETLLSWAMENMIKNSLDACKGGGGKVIVSIISMDNKALIQVEDTGKGISRKNWNNIFKPGFSTKQRGWGLGLSLTRRIVEDIHRGKLKLISSRPGKTVFGMFLPL